MFNNIRKEILAFFLVFAAVCLAPGYAYAYEGSYSLTLNRGDKITLNSVGSSSHSGYSNTLKARIGGMTYNLSSSFTWVYIASNDSTTVLLYDETNNPSGPTVNIGSTTVNAAWVKYQSGFNPAIFDLLFEDKYDPNAINQGGYPSGQPDFNDLTANFTIVRAAMYSVWVDILPNNVTPAAGTALGAGTYPAGSQVSLAATPGVGYRFSHWSKGGVSFGSANPFLIMVNANHALVANFVRINSTLRLIATPSGAGAVAGGGVYSTGTSVYITATAINNGYRFKNWTEGSDILGTLSPLPVTVSSDRTITANFVGLCTISTNVNPPGSNPVVGMVGGAGIYDLGVTVMLLATGENNYRFNGWTEGSTSLGTDYYLVFTAAANRSITANFVRQYTVSTKMLPSGVTPGAGTVTGAGTFDAGASATLTATPTSGYQFTGWLEGSTLLGSANPLRFTVNSNRTITANFTGSCILSVNVSPSGVTPAVGTVSGAGTYAPGAQVTLNATASTNYRFKEWFEGGTSLGILNPLQITINSSRTITANFVPQYTISTNVAPTANPVLGTVTGGGTYETGTVVSLTATPASDLSRLSNWTEAGTVIGTANPLTVTLNSNRNITANFAASCRLNVVIVRHPDIAAAVSTTVTKEVGGVSTNATVFPKGTKVTLTANTGTGAKLKHWSKAEPISTVQSITVSMDQDVNIEAYFVPIRILTIIDPGNGRINCLKIPFTPEFLDGEVAPLVARENSGYRFERWVGDIDDLDEDKIKKSDLNVLMNSNKSISAQFVPIASITLALEFRDSNDDLIPGGEIVKAPDKTQYQYKETVGVKLKVPGGYSFIGIRSKNGGEDIVDFWKVIVPNKEISFDLELERDIDAVVLVEKDKIVHLNVKVNNGTIIYNPQLKSSYLAANREKVTITVQPDVGYEFKSWGQDAFSAEKSLELIMENDWDITAVCEPVKFPLVLHAEHGKINFEPAPQAVIDDVPYFSRNTLVVLNAIADSGWKFLRWEGSVSGKDSPANLNMDGPKKVKAVFAPLKNNIEVYLLHNVKDSIVLQADIVDYPEVNIFTIAAVETLPDGTRKLYEGPERISLTFEMDENLVLLYHPAFDFGSVVRMLNLSLGNIENTLLNSEEFSFFKAIDLSTVSLLQTELESLTDQILKTNLGNINPPKVTFDLGSLGYKTFAVASWYTVPVPGSLYSLKIAPGTTADVQVTRKVDDLSNDTVGLVRSAFEHGVPKNFTGDPGKFIVNTAAIPEIAADRTYGNILYMKYYEAQGRLSLAGDSVPDWLEVSAADIYNNPNNDRDRFIFDNVWKVAAVHINDNNIQGYVDPAHAYQININLNCEVTRRANAYDQAWNMYGFCIYNARKEAFRHEALHCYHHPLADWNSFSVPLFDNDLDGGFVGNKSTGAQNSYFKFSWDNKKRGFISWLPLKNFINYYEGRLGEGAGGAFTRSGDNEYPDGTKKETYFVVRLNSCPGFSEVFDRILQGQAETFMLPPSVFPQDFPALAFGPQDQINEINYIRVIPIEVAVYSESIPLFFKNALEVKAEARDLARITASLGNYVPMVVGLNLKLNDNAQLLKGFAQGIRDNSIGLYVLICVDTNSNVSSRGYFTEPDASAFGIGLDISS